MTARERAEKAEKEIHELLKQWPPPEPVGTVMRETIRIVEHALLETIEAAAQIADIANSNIAAEIRKMKA